MNVLVEEQCLKDIAESIRKKSGVSTTYKPREMAVAIDALKIRYLITIEQSENQVITATCNGKQYTKSFMAKGGDKVTISIAPSTGYKAGKLNFTEIIVKADVSVNATPAIVDKSYNNLRFKIYKKYKNGSSSEYDSYIRCQVVGSSETFNIELFDRYSTNSRRIEVTENKTLQNWLEIQNNVAFYTNDETYRNKVATFKNSFSTRDFNAAFLLNFGSGRELIFKVQ